MDILKLVDIFNDPNSTVSDVYLSGKALVEEIEARLSSVKSSVESMNLGEYSNECIGKKLILSEVQKSTLDNAAIVKALSEEELRKSYKATESGLKSINRQDLIDANKKVTLVRQVRVYSL